ncbi:MAG: Rieske (2Fe-2S) protein [Propionibacteriales bacterium]|nr:Rieske (2Fe-2S) protein [Propionibacteriales bacterium]
MSPTKGVSVSDHETSRRNLLGGLAAAGVALPVLAACGSSSGSGDSTGTTAGDPSTSSGATGGSTGGSSGGSSGGGIKTSEIPVGGGRIFSSQQIVVTQPTAGQFKAFSSICTHQGCPVTKIEGGTIDCTCHGSKYSIKDGSVEDGPAPKPLPEKTVTLSPAGDTLTVS